MRRAFQRPLVTIGVGLIAAMVVIAVPVVAEMTRDQNGVRIADDPLRSTLELAAGRDIEGICVLESDSWPWAPPTSKEVVAAVDRGPGTLVIKGYRLGPVKDAAQGFGVQATFGDGSDGSVWGILEEGDDTTAVHLEKSQIAEAEVWHVAGTAVLGGCVDDRVPDYPA